MVKPTVMISPSPVDSRPTWVSPWTLHPALQHWSEYPDLHCRNSHSVKWQGERKTNQCFHRCLKVNAETQQEERSYLGIKQVLCQYSISRT